MLTGEDNADVRAYLRRHLSDSYQIVEATGGADGLSTARERTPDLMMPDRDGIELYQKLRSNDTLAQTPILLLTARATEDDTVAGLGTGVDAYVTKAFSTAELKARLRRHLEMSRHADPAGDLLAPDVETTSADEEFLDRVTDAIDENLGPDPVHCRRPRCQCGTQSPPAPA